LFFAPNLSSWILNWDDDDASGSDERDGGYVANVHSLFFSAFSPSAAPFSSWGRTCSVVAAAVADDAHADHASSEFGHRRFGSVKSWENWQESWPPNFA
jgi:hypothetical protein